MDARAGGRRGGDAPERERKERADWSALFARYGPLALRLARGVVPQPDQADDVVQEAARSVLERCARGAARFESPEHARNYFLRAVHSRAVDVLRASERERVQLVDLEPGGPAARGEDEARSLRAERVRRGLERLSPDQREVLELRYLEGLTFRAIAERTALPISTLHGRVEAGLERLRRLVGG